MDHEEIIAVMTGFLVHKADQLRAQISEYVPRPDYVQVNCDLCGMRIWIGPRQNMIRIVTEAPVWCVFCVFKNQKDAKITDSEFGIASLGGESAKIVLLDGREVKASFEM